MPQWSRLPTYQHWFYRVGLLGLVVIGLVVGVATARHDAPRSELLAGAPGSTESTVAAGPGVSTAPGAEAPFSLSSPTPGSHWSTQYVTFIGVAPPGATVQARDASAVVTNTGTFAVSVLLTTGQNDVDVIVTNTDGESSTVSVTIYYDPTPPPTKPRDTLPEHTPSTKPPDEGKPPKDSTTTTHGGGGGGSTSTTHTQPPTSTTEPKTTTTQEEG